MARSEDLFGSGVRQFLKFPAFSFLSYCQIIYLDAPSWLSMAHSLLICLELKQLLSIGSCFFKKKKEEKEEEEKTYHIEPIFALNGIRDCVYFICIIISP